MDSVEDFQPLRKSIKRKGAEIEDNFVLSYRDDAQLHTNSLIHHGGLSSQHADIVKLRYNYSIEVDDESCPDPVKTFKQASLPVEILDFLSKSQIYTPTSVQMQAIPILLSGRDVVAVAPTGSGKTLSYLLPLCAFLRRKAHKVCPKPGSPIALIITPTRELMQQVLETSLKILEFVGSRESSVAGDQRHFYQSHVPPYGTSVLQTNFNPSFLPNISVHPHQPQTAIAGLSTNNFITPPYNIQFPYNGTHWKPDSNPSYSVYGICGGIPMKLQIERLKQHVDIIVATPGRLLELSQKSLINLSSISFLVIDECDKLLDMGLEEQLRKLIAMITVCDIPRQTSLWSATLPSSLERLARSAVLNPVTMHVGLKDTVCKSISQNIIFMHSYQKPKKLLQTLRSTQFPPVLVFASSITVVDEIVELLKEEEFYAEGLHSQKEQEQRFKVLSDFRNGAFDVLVATDLASRGLDIPDITHVINYDTPNNIEDYIHRCGRTGRFGRPGLATTFLTLECKIANELKDMLESSGLPIPKDLEDTKQFGKKVLKTEFGDRII